ncbi:hypothetical protein JB92DRAFT_2951519 [Gautieria morchelliformis]|nr:hypothetical protein JB92DRAFT_2951519 [Gautieria morchelliformis]
MLTVRLVLPPIIFFYVAQPRHTTVAAAGKMMGAKCYYDQAQYSIISRKLFKLANQCPALFRHGRCGPPLAAIEHWPKRVTPSCQSILALALSYS